MADLRRNRRRARRTAGGGTSSGRERQNVQAQSNLEAKLAEGDFYEALQIYKTLYARHVAHKEHDQAMQLVIQGSRTLLGHAQLNAATELALMLIDLFTAQQPPRNVDDETRTMLRNVAAAYPPGAHAELTTFLKAALRWSTRAPGGRQTGDPAVHEMLARAYRSAACAACPAAYGQAADHYARAEAPEELAGMLVEWSKLGYASERDLFIARAALQFLSFGNLRDANAVQGAFKARLQQEGETPPDTPLMNFVSFLLRACERDAAPLFQVLRQRYSRSLARDPEFDRYLTAVGQHFFGMRPAPNMMNMLSSMLGGGRT